MSTALGIIIILVTMIIAAVLVYATRGAGGLKPYPPVPPPANLGEAITDVQTSIATTSSLLAQLSAAVQGATPLATSLAMAAANAKVPGASTLDTSAVDKAIASYTSALGGTSGIQILVTNYYNAVKGLSPIASPADVLKIDGINDQGAIASMAVLVQGGSQATADALRNLANIVAASAASAAPFPITDPTVTSAVSAANMAAQSILSLYGNFQDAAKQASAYISYLIQIASGIGPSSVGFRSGFSPGAFASPVSRRGFVRANQGCVPEYPGSECSPPFAVCMSERCRPQWGCDQIGAYWYGAQENPIIASSSGAGFALFP